MKRRTPPPLKVEQAEQLTLLTTDPDEFHPDPRVAALYADQKANASLQVWLKAEVARIDNSARLDPTVARLAMLETRKTQFAQAVEDGKEIEKTIEEGT